MHVGQRVSQISVMQISRQISRAWTQAALAGFLILALVSFAGARSASAAPTFDCTNNGQGPNMTIVIYNNSAGFNIYPVLFAGAPSDTDQWMRGCFRISFNNLAANPFPRPSQFRMYVNCCDTNQNGIPPGGSVTITLPFYSPLVQQINPNPGPKDPLQFIDWWQGGGINVFSTPLGTTEPPDVLKKHWSDDTHGLPANALPAPPQRVTPTRNAPVSTCTGVAGAACSLAFFSTPTSIGNWEPQQLIEYTLAAAGPDATRTDPNAPMFLWVPDNVDYDVSYVNFAYMPAAIEPFGNPLYGTCCAVGWVGTIDKIQATFKSIDNWSASSLGMGWPHYVDQTIPPANRTNPPATIPRKIPSGLELFKNFGSFNDNSNYYPAPSASPPLMRMQALWVDCFNGAAYAICGRIRDVNNLLMANYQNYVTVYNDYVNNRSKTWIDAWGCKTPAVTPIVQLPFLSHFYGWSPWNADSGCKTDVNLLEQTPGYNDPAQAPHDYATVKGEFDQLQYWFKVLNRQYGQWTNNTAADYGQFDPYVALVHGPDFLNAPYAYAYSVDDAVGNMQTDGTGLYIAVGGIGVPPNNLPNPDHVTPEVQFTFGYATTIAPNNPFAGLTMTMDKYGRCIPGPNTVSNPTFTTFVVPDGLEPPIPHTPDQPIPANSVRNCQVTLADNLNRSYTFKLKGYPSDFLRAPVDQRGWPDQATRTAENSKFIDCSGNADPDILNYCQQIFTYQEKDKNNPHLPTVYHVSLGAPPACNLNRQPCCAKRPQDPVCTKQ
jgi:hypothetical protein